MVLSWKLSIRALGFCVQLSYKLSYASNNADPECLVLELGRFFLCGPRPNIKYTSNLENNRPAPNPPLSDPLSDLCARLVHHM